MDNQSEDVVKEVENDLHNTEANSKSLHMCLRQNRKKNSYIAVPDTFEFNACHGIQNGRWSLEEHTKFIYAILEYGNKWKHIQAAIKTRNCFQARSHAQKFFSKLAKMNISGISAEMCNIKKLHEIALKCSKPDLNRLITLLTEVALEKFHGDHHENIKDHNITIADSDFTHINTTHDLGSNVIRVSIDDNNCNEDNKSETYMSCSHNVIDHAEDHPEEELSNLTHDTHDTHHDTHRVEKNTKIGTVQIVNTLHQSKIESCCSRNCDDFFHFENDWDLYDGRLSCHDEKAIVDNYHDFTGGLNFDILLSHNGNNANHNHSVYSDYEQIKEKISKSNFDIITPKALDTTVDRFEDVSYDICHYENKMYKRFFNNH